MIDDMLDSALEEYEKGKISIAAYAKSGIYDFANFDTREMYKDLPLTYFEIPQTEKYKKLLYEVAAKLWNTPEYIKLAKEGKTYFVMASHICGNLCSSAIFHEKGVFYSMLKPVFIPVEEMETIDADKKGWIFIKDHGGKQYFFPVMDSGKVKKEYEKFLKLLRTVYKLN